MTWQNKNNSIIIEAVYTAFISEAVYTASTWLNDTVYIVKAQLWVKGADNKNLTLNKLHVEPCCIIFPQSIPKKEHFPF